MGCQSSRGVEDPQRESKRRKKSDDTAPNVAQDCSYDAGFFSHGGNADIVGTPSPSLVDPATPAEKSTLSTTALASPKPSQSFEKENVSVNELIHGFEASAKKGASGTQSSPSQQRKQLNRLASDGTALIASPRPSAHDLSATNQRASVPVIQANVPSAKTQKGSAQKRSAESAPPPRKAKAKSKAHAARTSREAQSLGGEAWPAYIERVADVITEEAAVPLFEKFRTSDDLRVIFSSFARLSNLAMGGSPWDRDLRSSQPNRFPFEALRVLLGGHWKAKQLWEKLDRRCSRPEYADAPCGNNRLSSLCAIVTGAGPCGLRAAIEMRLLGAQVVVVERRTDFSRINQLHLWSWCGEDVKALGARCLEPPGLDFGANPDKLHVGISELQLLLLKTALLLGVEVYLGAEFRGYAWAGGWCVQLGNTTPDTPSPRAPDTIAGVGVLLGADGLGSGSVGKAVGVEAVEAGSLRAEDAIGLVVNFAPLEGAAERSLRSFAMAKQFFGPLFKDLSQQTGADLENIVYTKSKLSHYFVMTPTRKCLIKAGVVCDEAYKPMLARENVDMDALDKFARQIIGFRFKANEPSLVEAAKDAGVDKLEYADRGPQLFDFSKLRRASEGLLFCDPPQRGGTLDDEDEDALIVALVGDALLEPFWPEGLGIVRGFFSALDACSAITKWANGDSREATRQHFATAFTQLKSLSAATRASVLRPDESKYNLDPSSRYRAIAS